ncbi:hypothetical protein OH460_07580 [Vibrio sp. Makdt]|uniref:hypothetical protein n=1 Tax=Vibrio sp. Makdt TaxID=2998828 RepID=UPI0022CD7968|nr:hypothetical protein [Vibrio sp. Makdt]MDA0152158.1 hypothetical protein [Vibrio sp. Makdt]
MKLLNYLSNTNLTPLISEALRCEYNDSADDFAKKVVTDQMLMSHLYLRLLNPQKNEPIDIDLPKNIWDAIFANYFFTLYQSAEVLECESQIPFYAITKDKSRIASFDFGDFSEFNITEQVRPGIEHTIIFDDFAKANEYLYESGFIDELSYEQYQEHMLRFDCPFRRTTYTLFSETLTIRPISKSFLEFYAYKLQNLANIDPLIAIEMKPLEKEFEAWLQARLDIASKSIAQTYPITHLSVDVVVWEYLLSIYIKNGDNCIKLRPYFEQQANSE